MGFFNKIKEKFVGKSAKQNEKYVAGLDRSNVTFSDRINELAARFREINEDYFEELENILIMSDVGVSMVMKIVDEIKNEVRIQNITDPKQINDIIHKNIILIFYFLTGFGRINSAFRIIKYLDHILDLAEGTHSGSIG